MSETKKTVTQEIENTMACSAFAEAGEPCPLDSGESPRVAKVPPEGDCLKGDSIEDTFACTAFHEQNEECPICSTKK